MLGPQMKTSTNVILPISFILFALLSFGAAQITLLFNTDILINGSFRVPSLWMATHFLLLGFATMVVMGAMYQLVPVALLTPIFSEKLGFIQMIITIIGCTIFPILLGTKPGIAMYGAVIVIIGIVLFLAQMVLTISKQKKFTMMSIFIMTALLCLFLTIIAGFFLVWNITVSGITMSQAIFHSHLTFGIIGWFTLLIFGFSYKLVPMFSLSHGYSENGAKPAFISYIIGLMIMIISFWITEPLIQIIGWLLLLSGFTFFVTDIWEILQKRLRRKLDKAFSFSIMAIFIGLTIHLIAFIISIFQIDNPTIWATLILVYIIGWILFSILGYLYKIVPVLWWTHKYSEQMGKTKVPTLADMINEKLSILLYTLFIIGIIGIAIGIIAQISIIILIFQALFTIATIGYIISIVRVLFV